MGICPLRCKEFNTITEMQECIPDCAWLVRIPKTGFKACAVAVDACSGRTPNGKWMPVNYINEQAEVDG